MQAARDQDEDRSKAALSSSLRLLYHEARSGETRFFLLAFGKCQNSSRNPNTNYWKYEERLAFNPPSMLFVGLFFFFLFVFNDTNLALLPGAFWLSTRKQRSRGASVLEAGCVLGGRTARAGQTQTCAGSPEGLCCHAAVL